MGQVLVDHVVALESTGDISLSSIPHFAECTLDRNLWGLHSLSDQENG
jgi:hypothetical protein